MLAGNKQKAGVIPPFWSLSPFFVADVKSLGSLGKCARERKFMPRMAGLYALGHGCFPISLAITYLTTQAAFGYTSHPATFEPTPCRTRRKQMCRSHVQF